MTHTHLGLAVRAPVGLGTSLLHTGDSCNSVTAAQELSLGGHSSCCCCMLEHVACWSMLHVGACCSMLLLLFLHGLSLCLVTSDLSRLSSGVTLFRRLLLYPLLPKMLQLPCPLQSKLISSRTQGSVHLSNLLEDLTA